MAKPQLIYWQEPQTDEQAQLHREAEARFAKGQHELEESFGESVVILLALGLIVLGLCLATGVL